MDPRLEPQKLVISYRSDEDGNEICLGHTWIPLSEMLEDCDKFEWGKSELVARDRPLPVARKPRKPREARIGPGELDVKGIAKFVGASEADIREAMRPNAKGAREAPEDWRGRRLWYIKLSRRHRSGRKDTKRENNTYRFIAVNFRDWWQKHRSAQRRHDLEKF
jgi:hypothetical protein